MFPESSCLLVLQIRAFLKVVQMVERVAKSARNGNVFAHRLSMENIVSMVRIYIDILFFVDW